MKNTNRTFTFILLSSMVMMGAILLQNKFFPPVIPPEVPAAVADNGEGEIANEAADETRPDDETVQDQPDDQSVADKTDDQPEETATQSETPQVFKTLGALDAEGKNRFLVTLNSKGATVQRVEINARGKKGRYLYRDLETGGGYLGSLNCKDEPGGTRIQVIGDGTPAQEAGLQVGDLIKMVDETPILSQKEINAILAKKKRGKKVALQLERNGQPVNLTVTLTDKPISVIRPEPDTLDPGFEFPESFLFSILKKDPAGKNWPVITEQMRNGNWEVAEKIENGVRKVEFSFLLTKERLEKFEVAGPVRVVKRYWLEPLDEEQQTDLNTRSWHLNFEVEIENLADKGVDLAYRLDGPTGTPTEGWWYQMKINGNSRGLASLAGARDVVASSDAQSLIFKSGPDLVKNIEKEGELASLYVFDPFETDPDERKVNFIGVDAQYFNVSLIPKMEGEKKYEVFSAMAWPTGSAIPEKRRKQKLVDVTSAVFKEFKLGPQEKYSQEFEIFTGPKDPDILNVYGMKDVRAFGWFHMFSKPLCALLKFFHTITFQISYAIPIIMLTVLVRGLMLPVSRKAALNAQMMQHLAPEMKAIKEKYKDDMEKQAQAQRDLFKRNNYNPLGGCLMGFIQLPIFIGLYRGLSVDIALRGQPLIPGVKWCQDLSAPDQLMNWQSWMPDFIGSETGWLGPYLNVLPIFAVVLFLLQTKLFTPPPTDDQQKMMQKMMSFMMLFMGFLFYKMPAALCLYFIASSIWGICERKMLPKPKLDTSKLATTSGLTLDTAPEPVETVTNAQALEDRKRLKKMRQRKLKDR